MTVVWTCKTKKEKLYSFKRWKNPIEFGMVKWNLMCFKQGRDRCCNMLDQGYINILKTILKQQKQTFFLKLQNPNYSNKRHLQSKTRYLTRRTRVSWCKISIISPLNLSNLAKIIIPNTEKLNYGRALKTNALDWIMDIRVNRILAWSFKVGMYEVHFSRGFLIFYKILPRQIDSFQMCLIFR